MVAAGCPLDQSSSDWTAVAERAKDRLGEPRDIHLGSASVLVV
jgi:hypothetical protein